MPDLRIGATADLADVERKFSSAGDAVIRFGDDVDSASRKADASTSRMNSVADSADNLGSSSSQAAGGLGDLGGALAGLPGPLGGLGRGMEAAAPAIMGVTGAADLLNLASDKGAALMGKMTAAVKANTVVTKVSTVAQRALNLVMRANPIGLVVTALALLVGGLILAYKKSETFRAIVNKLGEVGAKALGWIIDKASALVGWIKDKLGPGVTRAKDIAVNAFKLWLAPIQFVIDKVKGVIDWLGDAIDATKRAIGLGKEYGSTMGGILGNISDSLNEVNEALRNSPAGQGGGGSDPAGRPGGQRIGGDTSTQRVEVDVNLNNGVVTDPEAVVRALYNMLNDSARAGGFGKYVVTMP